MQDDFIHHALHEIEIDIYHDINFVDRLSCSFSTTFEDLHYRICQILHMHPKGIYYFFIPRLQMTLRRIPRSKDIVDKKQLLSLITVGDEILYKNNEQSFSLRIRSIGIEIDKINMERGLRRAMVALKTTVDRSSYLKKHQIHHENLSLLYGFGHDMLHMKIHQLLANQSTLVFNLKGNHLLAHCLVTVTEDQVEYFFFTNQKDFQRYLYVKQDQYLANLHKEKYKRGLAMVISKIQLKETDATSPYNSQMYVEHGCYLYFYDVRRGYEVDVISNKQANDFMRYLIALQKTLVKIDTFSLEYKHDNLSLYIGYDPHSKSTILQTGPKAPPHIDMIEYQHEENITQLLALPRLMNTVELDYFLNVKKPIENQDERASYMLEGICLGRNIHNVISQPYIRDEQVDAMMVDILLDVIEEHGIPLKVFVRDRAVFAQVHSFCKQMGIEVEIYSKLPKIDTFHEECMKP